MNSKNIDIKIVKSKFDFCNVESHKFISLDFDYFVYHFTSQKIVLEILENGFKTGHELQKAEKRKAIFFSDKQVNPNIYSRNLEGELYHGELSGSVKVNIRNLKLLNLNFKNSYGEFENHSKFKNQVIKGELMNIPYNIDGTISFTKSNLIYEVVITKKTANILLNTYENK